MVMCGKCKNHHETVAEVRGCFGMTPVISVNQAILSREHNDEPSIKQVTFLKRLSEERGLTYADPCCMKHASAQIDTMLKMPKAAPQSHPDAKPAEVLQDGMYRKDDKIYKVQRAVHGSGQLYAKVLVPGEGYGAQAVFVYEPGALRFLTLGDRMTLEQAKEFGRLYGTCCRCGRTLTDEGSIAAGIGPVCASKF